MGIVGQSGSGKALVVPLLGCMTLTPEEYLLTIMMSRKLNFQVYADKSELFLKNHFFEGTIAGAAALMIHKHLLMRLSMLPKLLALMISL